MAGKRLGCWAQVVDIDSANASSYAGSFFNGLAKFSHIELMINENFSTETSWISSLASAADSISNAAIEVMISINFAGSTNSNGASLSDFQTYVNTLASYASIISIGVEGERSRIASGRALTLADITSAYNIVNLSGKRCINYYIGPSIAPLNAEIIGHTNYPYQDPLDTLSLYKSSPYVGQSQGYYAPYTENLWNQQVVDNILQTRGNIALPYSEFVSMAYFNALDSTFQGWVANSPYRNLFGDGSGLKTGVLTLSATVG